MSAWHIELPSELPIEYEARPDAQIFWLMCGYSVVFGAPGALALLHLVTDDHAGDDIVSALIIGSFFTLVGLLFVFLATPRGGFVSHCASQAKRYIANASWCLAWRSGANRCRFIVAS